MDDSARAASDSSQSEGASSTEDLMYDAFYGAAIGGVVIALLFLVVDSLAGRPMFTPALLGEVLFTDAEPTAVDTVRLDMVAYFTVVHFASFLVFGLLVSYGARAVGISKTNLPVMTTVIFVLLTVGFFGADLLVLQGVAEVIGIPLVLAGNLVTAIAMGIFLRKAHGGG